MPILFYLLATGAVTLSVGLWFLPWHDPVDVLSTPIVQVVVRALGSFAGFHAAIDLIRLGRKRSKKT